MVCGRRILAKMDWSSWRSPAFLVRSRVLATSSASRTFLVFADVVLANDAEGNGLRVAGEFEGGDIVGDVVPEGDFHLGWEFTWLDGYGPRRLRRDFGW